MQVIKLLFCIVAGVALAVVWLLILVAIVSRL